jgi:hypothetical protein
MVPPVLTAVSLGRMHNLEEGVRSFGLPEFQIDFSRTAPYYLEREILKLFKGKIFSSREWEKEQMVVRFDRSPKVSRRQKETHKGELEILIYPKNRKREGYLKGTLEYEYLMSKSGNRDVGYRMKSLAAADGIDRAPSKKTDTKLGPGEEAGWKKLQKEKMPIVLSALSGRWLKTNEQRGELLEFFGKNYFGTDGSELRLTEPTRKRYESLRSPDPSTTGPAGYRYVYSYEISRCHHRKEMTMRVEVIHEYDYASRARGYRISKLEKI